MKMSGSVEKRDKRLENKRRKAEAFLAIAELNNHDRAKKPKLDEGTITSSDATPKVMPQLVTNRPPLSPAELGDLKRRLREQRKARQCRPTFWLKAIGEQALIRGQKAESPVRENRTPLFMSDIQSLLTYCLCGDRAPYWPHRWCTLQKWNRLSNIVCVLLDGLGTKEVLERGSELAWLQSTLPLMEVVSPASYGSTIVQDLALIPVSGRQRGKLVREFGNLATAIEKNQAFKALRAAFPMKQKVEVVDKKVVEEWETHHLKLRLLLSARQLIMENYPLPLEGTMRELYKNYMLTKDEYVQVHENSPLFSVDCEMCLTEEGTELTQICVVNERLDVVYHTLVKPDNQITNYLTQYSGVTEEMLQDVTTRLSDVQAALRELLPPDAILVGQSLNCDLHALRMMHPYVIDTSIIYNLSGDRRRKSKLSALTAFFLNKMIQTGGMEGHSPVEDAKAAMSLVLLKLEKGYEYGDVLMGSKVAVPSNEQECLNVVQEKHDTQLFATISKTVNDNEKSVGVAVSASCSALYENFPTFKSELKAFQTGENYKEVLEHGKTLALQHNLSITHVDLAGHKQEKLCSRADRICRELYQHTSANGLFLVVLAGGPSNNAAVGVALCAQESALS